MDREYIHPSHDVSLFWDVPDPHNPAWQCRFCRLVTCGAGCRPGLGMDDDELAAMCAEVPPGWKPPLRQVPLKVVYDEIAAPPGTTRIAFGGGIVQLPNGNTFQIASGSITVTFAASGLTVVTTQGQDLICRLDELFLKGRAAQDAFGNAIRNGLIGPAGQPVPARAGKKDIPGSLTCVN